MKRSDYVNFYNRLAQTRTSYTECIKLTREDGVIFRFTALDKDLRVQEADGNYYIYKSADSFKLTALENSAGLVVSNMDISAIVVDDAISESDLFAGVFDNSNVELFIAYWRGPQHGTLPLRTSWMGEITLKGTEFRADLRGIAQKLAQVFTSLCSLECRWSFADTRCGINPATYTRTLTVTAVEANDTMIFGAMAGPDQGKFTWGLATWLTGQNVGGSMEILQNGGQRVHLFLPMPFTVNVGDSVSLIYGCDKVFKTCRDVYNNPRRFGGEPFLTGSDLIVSYPRTLADEEEDESGGKFG